MDGTRKIIIQLHCRIWFRSLTLCYAEFLLNLLFAEFPRMTFEHSNPLLHRHIDLVTNRDKALGEVFIIMHHETDSDHEVINVVEDERMLATVDFLALKEMNWMIPPVS
ncbi:hypothetical protein RRF57_002332 [Xylaria bambusicola]|uniref:Uncharacterized protein n=1 Tax=Xylaria bambusicola TaxID=326684 RepID=A0AAN7Z2D6_9PEZI